MKLQTLLVVGLCSLLGCVYPLIAEEKEKEETDRPKPIEINQQTLDIAEVVFQYMFENATDWDKQINRRFVQIQQKCPARLLERLQKETQLTVLSPFVRSDKDYPDGEFRRGRYYPLGDDSLFYRISSISEESDGTVQVSCSVVWALLAGRGYEYILKKKDGKWEVVEARPTWLS